MASETPSVQMLADLRERLKPLNIPIKFKLPKQDTLEPFLVIGQSSSDTSKTAQTGLIIEDMSVQIDIFLPGTESRAGVEKVKSEALRRIGHNRNVSASVLLDDTVGREVYHIVIALTDTIF